ncbi:MAG: HD domain-containing protein [Dehalococcoidia bacterium]|nr:MAG: HD domain-containing protein [Dehalococcoidia bacterium]
MKRLVDFDHASIALAEGDRLRFLAVSSMVETELGRGATIPLEKSVMEWVMENKKVNIERDFARERQFPIDVTFLNEGLRSAIRVPLFSKGEVFGAFNLVSRHPNAYGEREKEILLQVAGQIAVAIENAKLFAQAKQRKEELEVAYHQLVETAAALERGKQELEDAYLKMARTLVLTLEARDPYTRGHSERVVQISRQIAFEMGLSQEEMRNIETAARLHDLGKIGIPDGILLKPSAITPSERVEIQLHPTRAVELLRFLAFLEGTLPVIEHHHERYNGGGYPNSLHGEETPMGARILAVADAYDAMTSARPYRPAMTSERAIEILRQGAGTQWDPDVVEAFLRAFGN